MRRVGLLWSVSQNLPPTYSVTYILNVHPTEFGYNGSHSRKSLNLSNAAAPIPGSTPIVTRLPYPEFGAAGIQFLKADCVGSYNAFGSKLTQRFGSNLITLLSYT